MISMTTDSVLPRERAEFWTDLVSRHVTPMCIEPAGEHPLHGEVQVQVIGDLGVAQVSGRGVHASHTRVQIARTRGHLYAACIHLDGEARISHLGEQIALRKGDIFITDSRHEFTLDLERPWRHLLVTLPVEWIDSRVSRPELLSGAVLNGLPLARLWASHLASGFRLAAGTEGIDTHAGADLRYQQRDGHAALVRRARPSSCKTPDQTGGFSSVGY